MLKYHDIEQNSDEWFNMRAARLTSSKLGTVMANFGKAFGEPAKKYATEIALERITGVPCSSNYQNEAMARGHEEEPLARQLYEQETFCDVANGGFFCNEVIGCSPDGLVDENGVIEIKSAVPSMHFSRIKKQSYDSAYKWQLIGNVKYTGREWIDFVSYCSAYPKDKRLYVFRLWADRLEQEFKMIDERVSEFLDLVGSCEATIKKSEYLIQEA